MDDSVFGFFIGVFIATVVACFIPGPSTDPAGMAWAEEVCSPNGGLDRFRPDEIFGPPGKAVCNNSAVFTKPSEPEKK